MGEQETEEAIAAQAKALAQVLDDPKALARNLADWIKKNYPERVAQAYWISAAGAKDKGLEVSVYKLPWTWAKKLKLGLSGLIGEKTAGANINTTVWQSATGTWEAMVGVGAVAAYTDLQAGKFVWSPVASVSFRVRL